MEMEHAYTYAVAALVDQVDRALCATEGEPARLAVESSLAHTLKRLGCRSDNPLEWKPPWDWEKELSDDLVIEAYLKAKWRSGADTLVTAGWRERAKGPLRPSAWAVTEKERAERGPMLYEGQCACDFARCLARRGVAAWADITIHQRSDRSLHDLANAEILKFFETGVYTSRHKR